MKSTVKLVVPKEKPLPFPKLMKYIPDIDAGDSPGEHIIVLMQGPNANGCSKGVVVSTNNEAHVIGGLRDWLVSEFEDFLGSVTLSNK